MDVTDKDTPTPEEKDKAEEQVKQEDIEGLMLEMYGNSSFGTIKNDLENKMACGSDSYPRTKDKEWG